MQKINFAFLLRRYSEQDNLKGHTITMLEREEKI